MHDPSPQQRLLQPAFAVVTAALVSLATVSLPLAARADADGGSAAATIRVVDGTASLGRGDGDRTVAVAPDTLVRGGDYLSTGDDSLLDVQFDARTSVRAGARAQLRFAQIDRAERRIQLAAGTIELRLFRGTDGSTTIDTPSISVTPHAAGSYRITVDDEGTTLVTVRAGYADIDTPQNDRPLDPGTTLVARGPAANPQIDERDAVALDDFDAFNRDRDRAIVAAFAYRQMQNRPSYSVPVSQGPGIPSYARPIGW